MGTKKDSVIYIEGINAIHTLLSHHQDTSRSLLPIDFSYVGEDETGMTIIDAPDSKKDDSGVSKDSIKFIDEYKDIVIYRPVMVDSSKCFYGTGCNGTLDIFTNVRCWWDGHTFDTSPIGCPINYYSSNDDKRIVSNVRYQAEIMNIKSDTSDFYEVEGVFCSCECVKAYILSQKDKIKYANSLTLLTRLVRSLTGTIKNINRAPSWKLIDSYGGHMTIEEFRESFDILKYSETINAKRPYMYGIFTYHSEKKISQ